MVPCFHSSLLVLDMNLLYLLTFFFCFFSFYNSKNQSIWTVPLKWKSKMPQSCIMSLLFSWKSSCPLSTTTFFSPAPIGRKLWYCNNQSMTSCWAVKTENKEEWEMMTYLRKVVVWLLLSVHIKITDVIHSLKFKSNQIYIF